MAIMNKKKYFQFFVLLVYEHDFFRCLPLQYTAPAASNSQKAV